MSELHSERSLAVLHGLHGLLGPAGPEVTCEACFEELDVYVELAVAGLDADAAVPGMRAHLEGCPACGEDRDSLVALIQALQDPPEAG